jgi:membrane-associated phospholipid phosphatase
VRAPRAAGLRPLLFATGVLAAGFVLFTVLVSLHTTDRLDHGVANLLADAWVPASLLLWQAIAFLGGIEVTTLIAVAVFVYLWRAGYRWASAAVLAFPVGVVLESLYKRTLSHPEPAGHGDAPSIASLFSFDFTSSFPSGHVTRAVIVYGLLAFTVARLAARPSLRRLALPLAVFLLALIAFDRLYLEVHWESDVVGGLLLGGTLLAGAITWMEWTARTARD